MTYTTKCLSLYGSSTSNQVKQNIGAIFLRCCGVQADIWAVSVWSTVFEIYLCALVEISNVQKAKTDLSKNLNIYTHSFKILPQQKHTNFMPEKNGT